MSGRFWIIGIGLACGLGCSNAPITDALDCVWPGRVGPVDGPIHGGVMGQPPVIVPVAPVPPAAPVPFPTAPVPAPPPPGFGV